MSGQIPWPTALRVLAAIASLAGPLLGLADTVIIPATADATLIEDDAGLLANGSGPALFVGRTGQSAGAIRRAIVRFELAGNLPSDAIIERVYLDLHLTPSNEQDTTISVHRLLQPWSEGPAYSSGGAGAAAATGDTTWLHTHHAEQFWIAAGGHFVQHPSASSVVGAEDFYTWQDSAELRSDVRVWQHAPHRNFGWILIGDEESTQSVKRFDSRESADAATHPTLTIIFRLPGNTR